ncbi:MULTISPECIES: hypothetical protein [unclassified Fusibacter]|uniref:hypothetical protein n=1 Tax=unclassified Fusibacter TaxID=2624464 RepID=UPI001010688E|nr:MULTISPECIES: hypothetical protein [unclassified Fusibacter]MCK8061018.1 hypothetical protein [Fusibacter sp. A2]NPE20528.1 hypothetical protein [Fusibacter sp. A1]RXV63726.1 hypothetical protein DWB64_01755 [Fusibacter sp. A1]
MNQQIETLKHYVLQLEHAIATSDADVVRNTTRVMKDLLGQIDYDFKSVKEKTTGIYFKSINTIPFLYKPVYKLNPYEGDFLETFSMERTEQLKRAGAIGEHNKFWTDHNVIKGNVFGSVPKELISEDAAFALKQMGWDEVKVEILDFGKRVTDIKEIYEFCEENFKQFIMISEGPTQAMLALKFAV